MGVKDGIVITFSEYYMEEITCLTLRAKDQVDHQREVHINVI